MSETKRMLWRLDERPVRRSWWLVQWLRRLADALERRAYATRRSCWRDERAFGGFLNWARSNTSRGRS